MMDVLNIVALILVPILAVIVGQKLQDRAQKRNDKMQIFKILMTSRIFGWTNESVQAMNLIDIVLLMMKLFGNNGKSALIRCAWRNQLIQNYPKSKLKEKSCWKRWQNPWGIRI